MKKRLLSLGFVMILALSMCYGIASAAETRASTTISFYTVSASEGDNSGEIKITYDVRASKVADEVGISSIKIYKSNGTPVTTITGTTENGLIRSDTTRHKSTYVYKGDSGVSYYAVVTGFATIGSDSDSRKQTTDTIKAP